VPLLNISTNKKIKNEQMFLAKSSDFISSLLKKPIIPDINNKIAEKENADGNRNKLT